MSSAESGPVPESVSFAPAASPSMSAQVSQGQRLAGLVIVISVALVPLITSSIFTVMGVDTYQSDAAISYRYASAMMRELISLALLAYVIRQNQQVWSDFGLVFRPSDVGFGVLLWIAAVCCYDLARPSILSFSETLGWHRSAANVPAYKLGGFLVVCYVVSSPVFEELIVRAYVMTEIVALTGSSALGILVSVLLQTSYHLYQGVPYALAAAVIFLIYSIYYARTRRIMPIILAHFAWDVAAFLSYAAHQIPVKHS